jgi:hypothetical protein
MKKLNFMLITAVVMTFVVTVSVQAQTFKLADHYKGDRRQGPEWYYMIREDKGKWQELYHTPVWGDNWQYSKNPTAENIYYSLCTWEGVVTVQSGVKYGSVFETAVAFKAPKRGTITIPDFTVISHGAEDPADDPPGPVGVKILLGTKELSSTVVRTRSGTTVKGATSDVRSGDMVYIYIDPMGVEVTNVILDNLSLIFK